MENTDLAVRQLGQSIHILVASPGLAARLAEPGSIESVKGWPTLCMASSSERFVWNLVDAEGGGRSLVHQPRLATDDLVSLRVAAISGVGVALLPRELVEADIQAGRLQRLLPGLATAPALVHAIFPTRRGMVPAVRHLLDALVAGCEDLNWQR